MARKDAMLMPGYVYSRLADPYPEVEGPADPATLDMLMDDYSGVVSEVTAVMQYVYQHAVIADESLAEAIVLIAVDEMKHLELLAEALAKLGRDPRYGEGVRAWRSGYVDYSPPAAPAMEADIRAEENAIAKYRLHAQRIGNPSLKALINRIIRDEELHLAFFRKAAGRQS